jgi:predicted glycosyltransferase
VKIWLDFCEPKSVTMLRPLYDKFSESHEVFITARDFDSTFYLLDKWGVDYIPVGEYGGKNLIGKLRSYSKRLSELIEIIYKENPEFLFCITSPEALRVSFGLQIPNIMFNDEPRSYGPCSMTLPYVNQVIVPKCIPIKWYLEYGLKEEKIIRFNGIDEVGWLSNFEPNEEILKDLNLSKENYIVCRTEPTKAGYLVNEMEPHETQLATIIPEIIQKTTDFKFLVITRNEEQFAYLTKKFESRIKEDKIQVYRGLENLSQIIYFAKLVLTGGGTMVRESALLGVPSIEFLPLETYPQEQFLIDNGFPLKHFHDAEDSIKQALEYLEGNYRIDTFKKIEELENPIAIGIEEFEKRVKTE